LIIRSLDQVPRVTALKRFPVPRNFGVSPESRIKRERTWPASASATRVKALEVYRYDPDSEGNPRLDTSPELSAPWSAASRFGPPVHITSPHACELASPSHCLGRGISVHAAYGARSLVAARHHSQPRAVDVSKCSTCFRVRQARAFSALVCADAGFRARGQRDLGTFCGVAAARDRPCMISYEHADQR
jgi:hypothetical protein